MKTFIFSLMAASLLLCSCTKKETTPQQETPQPVKESTFTGTMTVEEAGAPFVTENVEVKVTPVSETSVDLTFVNVKFSPRMPLSLTVGVGGVSCNPDKDGYVLSGDNIVPTALGGPYPRYTVTGLSGTLKDGSLSLNLHFGTFPVTFAGSKKD